MNDHRRQERSRWTAILVGILVAVIAMFVIVWFTLSSERELTDPLVSSNGSDLVMPNHDVEVHVAR